MRVYDNAALDFSLSYPSTWALTEEKNDSGRTIFFTAPTYLPRIALLKVEDDVTDPVTLDMMESFGLKTMSSKTGFHVLRREDGKVMGIPARKVTASYGQFQGKPVEITYVFFQAQHLYVLTLFGLNTDAALNNILFQNILDSIVLRKK